MCYEMAVSNKDNLYDKITSEIKFTFHKLQEAVSNREKQLLRQIEVISHYSLAATNNKDLKNVSIQFNNENDILNSINNFGLIDFDELSHGNEFFQIEEYQQPEKDHVSLYKYLETSIAETESSNSSKHSSKSASPTTKNPDDKYLKIVPQPILKCIQHDDPKLCVHTKNCGKKLSDALETKEEVTLCDKECVSCKCNQYSNNENTIINNKVEITEDFKHPKQVEHWMNQIINEIEIEPNSNNTMETSKIK